MMKCFINVEVCKRKWWLFLFLTFVLSSEKVKAQDYNNPCFFCHMNIIVEMKAKASKHWTSDVNCEACHGPSDEHVDVEDNSIKPDSIWIEKDVHNLCNNCHDDIFKLYKKSVHAKFLIGEKKKDDGPKSPSCVSCHGAHGQKAKADIQNVCVGCHTPLPKTCDAEPAEKDSIEISITCKRCHHSHSLESTMKSSDEHKEK